MLAVILLAASAALLLNELRARGADQRRAGTTPLTLLGSQLELTGGAGRVVGDALQVTSVPLRRATALARELELSASDYAVAEIEAHSSAPGVQPMILWRTADDPTLTRGAPLQSSGGRRFSLRVGALSAWQGTVTSLGIGIAAPFRGEFRIDSLTLVPTGERELSQAWNDWTALEGLRRSSANFVLGAPNRRRLAILPVEAVAMWVGLALVLYVVFLFVVKARPDPRVVAALGLVGWLVLDFRWQRDLWCQAQVTRAGTQEDDVDLRALAANVAAHLPSQPQVLFVLTRDPEGTGRFIQGRLRYHLLPHNVINYFAYPPADVPSGSYLLVTGPRTDFAYDSERELIHWNFDGGQPRPGHRLTRSRPASLVFRGVLATLYRVS